MKKLSILFGLGLLLVGAGCQDAMNNDDSILLEESEVAGETSELSDLDDPNVQPVQPTQYYVALENVSASPDWQGEAQIIMSEDETRVYASFNMEPAESGYFYEGWLLCGGEPLSTGATQRSEALEENYFISNGPLEDCTEYILTLEPDDNDPAPGEHLFSGPIERTVQYFGDDYWYTEEFQARATAE